MCVSLMVSSRSASSRVAAGGFLRWSEVAAFAGWCFVKLLRSCLNVL